MIVDCFMFFNELDMLLVRFDYLYDFVDYFILVESREVHSDTMLKKECYFENNKHKFSKYLNKVIHIIVDELPKHTNSTGNHALGWCRENFQRNSIMLGIDKLNLNDNDIIIISDLDEIPNKHKLKNILTEMEMNNNFEPFLLNGIHFNYTLEYICLAQDGNSFDKWPCNNVCRYIDLVKRYDNKPQELKHDINKKSFENSAWHLGWFGNAEYLQYKSIACADPIAPVNKSILEWDNVKKNKTDPCWCRGKNYLKYVPIQNIIELPDNYHLIMRLFS